MNNIQISIIAPVFKVEKYIERFLLSVMSQTYNHSELECILVDDCTPDRSMDIAKQKYWGVFRRHYDHWINFVRIVATSLNFLH